MDLRRECAVNWALVRNLQQACALSDGLFEMGLMFRQTSIRLLQLRHQLLARARFAQGPQGGKTGFIQDAVGARQPSNRRRCRSAAPSPLHAVEIESARDWGDGDERATQRRARVHVGTGSPQGRPASVRDWCRPGTRHGPPPRPRAPVASTPWAIAECEDSCGPFARLDVRGVMLQQRIRRRLKAKLADREVRAAIDHGRP